jgi:hypothetical protein
MLFKCGICSTILDTAGVVSHRKKLCHCEIHKKYFYTKFLSISMMKYRYNIRIGPGFIVTGVAVGLKG